MTRLDAAACSAVDSTGQFAETLDLGLHLEDALWRVDSAKIAPVDAHGGLIVAGMGGSSVGGRLAAAVLGPDLRRPLALAMGYDIPAWIGRETLVLCSSYSGATEETLATYDAAKRAGAHVGDGTRVEGHSMLGEGVRVGAGNVITNGARLFPGVSIPDGGILF